jgi:hypothetical protein
MLPSRLLKTFISSSEEDHGYQGYREVKYFSITEIMISNNEKATLCSKGNCVIVYGDTARLINIIAVAAVIMILAGCGQKTCLMQKKRYVQKGMSLFYNPFFYYFRFRATPSNNIKYFMNYA